MQNVVDLITDDQKNDLRLSGYVVVGQNNSGKTYQLLDIFSRIEGKKKPAYEYSAKEFIFLSKEMTQGKIGEDAEFKEGVESDLSSLIETEIKIDYKNDLLNESPISQLIYGELANHEDEYNMLLKEFLDIEIRVEDRVLIKDQDSEGFVELESSGYISLIRTFVILYKLLTPQIKYILLDEADDSIDYNHKTNFVNFLENIKKIKKSEAAIVLVTHNSETVFNLPENYKILKIQRGKVIKVYYSQDFPTKDRLEKAVFDASTREHYISEKLKTLVSLYKDYLEKGSFNERIFGTLNYETLSFKEKVIYNSLKRSIGL
ncbi:MAG: ABC transporter ATP-binding protein [Cetobacterium sp.]|uniref:ATP-binding cassette domain-containing protein n=1 Tax=Cetobacterium sp. TaxID=2071632 RepID=UPI003F2C2AAE